MGQKDRAQILVLVLTLAFAFAAFAYMFSDRKLEIEQKKADKKIIELSERIHRLERQDTINQTIHMYLWKKQESILENERR